jgi:hypothetical protein
LEFLESLNQNLKKFQKNMLTGEKTQAAGSAPANNKVAIHKNQSTFNADVSITLASITNLFELSGGFSEHQLVNLMNSVVRIITEFLDIKLKKKKSETLIEDERICQLNLGVIWKANHHRLHLIASETKNIVTAYMSNSMTSVKEFGITRVIELLKVMQGSTDE